MTQRLAPDDRFHAPSPIRYSENMARVGSCIRISSESGITLDNSVSRLAPIVVHQDKE